MSVIPNFPQNLLDIHHAWHSPAGHPGLSTRASQFGPGSGIEFLQFHRSYAAQFHAWYDGQPGADQTAVAPWTTVPSQVKVPARGWNANLAAQEQRITTNTPPFATADDLGQFVENGIHNWIHGAVAVAFNDPSVGDFHSPRSTYFWQIHGLVDFWWQQWRAPKSRLKDIVDADPKFIRDEKVDKFALRENKRFQKDVIPDGKNQFKEIKEKDKDKDLVENPGLEEALVNPVINPQAVQIQDLAQRLESLEGFITRPSFIRAAERPDVGPPAPHEEGGEG